MKTTEEHVQFIKDNIRQYIKNIDDWNISSYEDENGIPFRITMNCKWTINTDNAYNDRKSGFVIVFEIDSDSSDVYDIQVLYRSGNTADRIYNEYDQKYGLYKIEKFDEHFIYEESSKNLTKKMLREAGVKFRQFMRQCRKNALSEAKLISDTFGV
jgi:hypothetical protein